MTDKCLFSAPYSFLGEEIQQAYQKIMPTIFREIWDKTEVVPDPEIVAWIPNPGQRFTIDDRILDCYPNLQVLITPSTGTNHIDKQASSERDIPVFGLLDNRPCLDTISASAEFSFLLLLNVLRRLDVAVQEVSEGRWRHREDTLRGRELDGKKVGLVGFGRVGKRLARYSTAFRAEVAYYDPYVDEDGLPKFDSLEALFSQSDLICICCPLTSETTGMIDRSLLECLKPNACLVNTSRGEVIAEADLVEILQKRPDIQVSLDVVCGEVTNTHLNSPLIEMHRQGRIVITPHIAGASVESQTKAAMCTLQLLEKFWESQEK